MTPQTSWHVFGNDADHSAQRIAIALGLINQLMNRLDFGIVDNPQIVLCNQHLDRLDIGWLVAARINKAHLLYVTND